MNLQRLVQEIRGTWIPQPKLPLIEWLPEHIRLPPEDSDNPGPYRVEFVPYFWGVMHALDSPVSWMVVMQKAAQIGWTVLLAADICKVAVTDPARVLMLFPKDAKGRNFMDEKFVKIVESSPKVAGVVEVNTSRKSGSTATRKVFPGGEVRTVGSNSVSNVKSTTAKRGYVEEPDDTNKDVGDQGDAIRHLRERLKRMRNKKLVIGGTPAVADLSQVEHYTKLGTMRVLPVACHDCGESHLLDWENVSWLQKEGGTPHPVFGLHQPDTAVYSCPHCGSAWDDYRRQANILQTCKAARDSGDPFAGWVKTQCGEGFEAGEIEPIETFMELSELYVCIPGTGLASVVRDYLEAEHEARAGDESARIVFQNNKLGRPYQYAANQLLDHEKLQEAAEDYPELCCPAGGLLVTAGIDVQHNRLAITLRAFGRNEESWQLYWGEIDGDTADKRDDCWAALDKLVFQAFEHERFGKIRAASVSIDASDGATSNAVYHWVRTRTKRYRGTLVMAIKGDSNDLGTKEIFTQPRQVDYANPKRRTKADRFGVRVYIVGTHKAKDLIAKRLLGTSAYMHSCRHVRQDYWEQVTAEVKAPSKKHRGKLLWQPRPGKPNEGLDTEVYALHAAHAKGMHKLTDTKWSEIESCLGQRTLFNAQPHEQLNEQPQPAPSQPRRPAQPAGSLLDD
ncbi:terminase gpA endonuclease subunit [Microbulbifer sp. TYP-18]|uniref:terminase gpA endonuclease subunit n=1 Tax=Microbulbifer sp. TYP-18 TaxID=3230024 RepID=UPI0034C6BCBC